MDSIMGALARVGMDSIMGALAGDPSGQRYRRLGLLCLFTQQQQQQQQRRR